MDAELAGKPFSLEVENDLGKTTYEFDLSLDNSGTGQSVSVGIMFALSWLMIYNI